MRTAHFDDDDKLFGFLHNYYCKARGRPDNQRITTSFHFNFLGTNTMATNVTFNNFKRFPPLPTKRVKALGGMCVRTNLSGNIGSGPQRYVPFDTYFNLDQMRKRKLGTPKVGDRVRIKQSDVFDETTGKMVNFGLVGTLTEIRNVRNKQRWTNEKSMGYYVMPCNERQDVKNWTDRPEPYKHGVWATADQLEIIE